LTGHCITVDGLSCCTVSGTPFGPAQGTATPFGPAQSRTTPGALFCILQHLTFPKNGSVTIRLDRPVRDFIVATLTDRR
jgi:hypothetical protein